MKCDSIVIKATGWDNSANLSPVQTVKLTLTWLNYADAACTFFTQQLGPFNSTTVVFFCYDLLGC